MIKKTIFLISVLMLAFLFMHAQAGDEETWNQKRLNVQKNGMIILGSWAFANFAFSGYQMTQTSNQTYYFHQMNVLWNTVNAGIAVSGYLSAINGPTSLAPIETLMEFNNFSKILLLNTGLDVAYMGVGLYLRERSRNIKKQSNRFMGYGNSLLMQGGFLLLFDLMLVLTNENLTRQFLNQENINFAISPGSFTLMLSF